MTIQIGNAVLEFLTDHSFLGAMASLVGPLAFFAAPTEEIERMIFADNEAFVGERQRVSSPTSVAKIGDLVGTTHN